LSGTWRRQGDQILLGGEIVSTEQNCRADHVRLDEAFAQLMRSRPHFLVGPNGELLLAGGGHALKGERLKER
jgi:heat shock protein HslJ